MAAFADGATANAAAAAAPATTGPPAQVARTARTGERAARTAREDKPKKRGGQRLAVECACQLHMTPEQIEDGPVICGVCGTPFEAPEDSDQDKTGEN